MNPFTTVLINGEARDSISIHDRGLQYGDGLFETIAVCVGQPLLWERHLARLLRGCTRLGIEPPAPQVLYGESQRLCDGVARAVLKLVLTRGPGARGYAPRDSGPPTRALCLRPWPQYDAAYAETGVDVRICRTRVSRNPQLAGIKHLNRLEQVLARAEWQTDFAEGLMFDDRERLIEGTASNVFLVWKGTLLTPELSEAGVEGVMRETVLEYMREAALPCEITEISRTRLDSADELFLTNSLIGIWPIRRVESKSYSIGAVTRRLQQSLEKFYCRGEAD